MAEGFEDALDQIFEPGAARNPPAVKGPSPAVADASAAGEAYDHYRRALAAQREGDWARYGDEIRKVGEILESLLGKRETAQPQANPEGARP